LLIYTPEYILAEENRPGCFLLTENEKSVLILFAFARFLQISISQQNSKHKNKEGWEGRERASASSIARNRWDEGLIS
jgi:hypothetical protein